jgi:integrase
MSLYKRNSIYWMEFLYSGRRFRRTTGVSNRRQAEQIEAAFKTQLARGEVGIEDDKPAPTLKAFAQQFVDFVETRHAEKPQTVDFYTRKLAQLLKFEPLRERRLDQIDEALVERYVIWRRKEVSPTTVNRELATLRRLLHVAEEWKLIRRVPRIRLLSGEKQRDFVLSHEDETRYLLAAPEPLKSLAVILVDTGLRLGEALNLLVDDVHVRPAGGARYGWIHVRAGKSKNAKRNVPLTDRVSQLLTKRLAGSSSRWVFPGESGERPILGTSLAHAHIKVCRPNVTVGKKTKKQYIFPKDFVLHSLRHTCLTRLGEAGADAFTIMRLAGHSSVTVSQRYVHPTPESMERAFDRLEALNSKAMERANGVESPQNSPHLLASTS